LPALGGGFPSIICTISGVCRGGQRIYTRCCPYPVRGKRYARPLFCGVNNSRDGCVQTRRRKRKTRGGGWGLLFGSTWRRHSAGVGWHLAIRKGKQDEREGCVTLFECAAITVFHFWAVLLSHLRYGSFLPHPLLPTEQTGSPFLSPTPLRNVKRGPKRERGSVRHLVSTKLNPIAFDTLRSGSLFVFLHSPIIIHPCW
jgi:hypothetical protein